MNCISQYNSDRLLYGGENPSRILNTISCHLIVSTPVSQRRRVIAGNLSMSRFLRHSEEKQIVTFKDSWEAFATLQFTLELDLERIEIVGFK